MPDRVRSPAHDRKCSDRTAVETIIAAPRPGHERGSRRRSLICPFCRVPLCKNISLSPSGKSSLQICAIPFRKRDVGHRHKRWDGMRWTRQRFARDGIAGQVGRLVSGHQASGREMLQRTAKSCGPDAPTLASSSRSGVGPTGLRQNISVGDGGKPARSPGSTKETVETIAGTSGDPVYSLLLVCVLPLQCTRGRGCIGHPAFPTPSLGGRFIQRLGRFASRGRSRMRDYDGGDDTPHSPPSSPANAGDPVLRGVND
jgi:hypothetical protein